MKTELAALDLVEYTLRDIDKELIRAINKHGFDNTPMNPEKPVERSFIILAEEFGEVARALTYDEGDKVNLRAELIQTAAMAVAMVIGHDLREAGE